MNMSALKKDEIKQQILQWIAQEQDWKIEVSNDHYYYFACLIRLGHDMSCNVCIEQHIERVNIIANAKLSERDRLNYKLTPGREKFWIDLKMNLIHVGVNVTAFPEVENLESVQLAKTIYFDGWTQDKFIDTILKVTDALEMTELIFRNFSDTMTHRLQKD
jgi:hypothetical protein